MTTHGPSFIWDTTTPFASGFVWDTLRGLGMRAQDIPSSGTDGAPPWYTALSLPADNGSEIRIVVTSPPTLGGTLALDGAGGFNYSGPADSFTWQGYQDGALMGSAVVTLLGGTSTVTGVTISPSTASGSATFTGTVEGTGSPSQVINWSTDGGSITSGGVFTAPAATGSIQIITVTGASAQDGRYSDTATVTIAAAPGGDATPAPRYARPLSDVTPGAWLPSVGGSLAPMLDEVSADASDYIATTAPSICRIKLSAVADPHTSGNQTFRYQAWAAAGGALTVRFMQGSTTIASWVHASLPSTPTIIAQTLTGSQCDAITDYADLYVEFEAG